MPYPIEKLIVTLTKPDKKTMHVLYGKHFCPRYKELCMDQPVDNANHIVQSSD
jgi:hypothetical protein